MRTLTHEQAAELLAADGRAIPASPHDTEDVVIAQLLAHGGRADGGALELAQEYGDYPDTAPAHMARCLAAVPAVVQVPDWPERGADGRIYTGMVDE